LKGKREKVSIQSQKRQILDIRGGKRREYTEKGKRGKGQFPPFSRIP